MNDKSIILKGGTMPRPQLSTIRNLAIIWMLLTVFFPVFAEDSAGYRHPIWGAPEPIQSHVRIQYLPQVSGMPLILRLDIDNKPYTYVTFSEYLGGPNLHVLTSDLIALEGCGDNKEKCDHVWRVLQLSNKSLSPIKFVDFDKDKSRPVFAKSYMGYRGYPTAGIPTCVIYDWQSGNVVARWSPNGKVANQDRSHHISVQFSADGKTATCREVIGTKPNPSYAGGDEPRELPVIGAERTFSLNDQVDK